MTRHTTLLAAAALVAAASTAGIAAAGGVSDDHHHRDDNVTICHATGAATYQRLTLSPNAVLSAHAKVHPDDIIPPFDYDGRDDASVASGDHHGHMFAGQNWDATGQMTWSNGCVPAPAPVPFTPLSPSTPITPPPVPPDNPPFIPLIPAVTAQSSGVVSSVTYCHLSNDVYSNATGSPSAVLDHIRTDQGDIVPPFMWQSGTSVYAFPGLNWTVGGEETWGAGCKGMRTVADAVAGEAIIRVSITPQKRRPAVGSSVRFTLTAKTLGPSPASGSKLCVKLPKTLSFVAAPKGRISHQGACWTTEIASKGTTTRTFTAKVKKGMGGAMIHVDALFSAKNAVSYRAIGAITPPRPGVRVRT